MVIRHVELETVCGVTSKIPDNPYPEIAFAGKSNVGKSSLINTLLNRKGLAHTSSQPGKTQTINFYNINDCMYLVDLPGYGYTRANVEIKAQWGQMIEHYLHVSKQLAAVFLLVDIRHDPSENDRIMYDWMVSQGYEPIIIATKLDKITKSQLAAHLDAIQRGLDPDGELMILPFSALTKQGREEIWEVIDQITGVAEETTQNPWAEEAEVEKVSEDVSDEQVDSKTVNSMNGNSVIKSTTATEQPARKPRWKDTGKPVAKKTQKMQKMRQKKKQKTK